MTAIEKVCVALYSVLMYGALLLFSVGNSAWGQEQFVPNRVIVKFKHTWSASAAEKFKDGMKRAQDVSSVKKLQLIDAEVWNISKGTVQDVIAQWKNDPRIKYIEPDYIVHASVLPNDPSFASLWGMTRIQAPQAWDTTTGGNVLLGVIDTGVDYLHPDLAASIWTNPGESGGGKETNGIDDDNNGYVDDVHGYDFANSDGDPMDDNNPQRVRQREQADCVDAEVGGGEVNLLKLNGLNGKQ